MKKHLQKLSLLLILTPILMAWVNNNTAEYWVDNVQYTFDGSDFYAKINKNKNKNLKIKNFNWRKYIEKTNIDGTKNLYIISKSTTQLTSTSNYLSIEETKIGKLSSLEAANADGTKTLYMFELSSKIENYIGEIKKHLIFGIEYLETNYNNKTKKLYSSDDFNINIGPYISFKEQKIYNQKWIETTNVDGTKTLYIGNDLWRKTEKYKSYKEKKIYNQNWIETTDNDGMKTLYTVDLRLKTEKYKSYKEQKIYNQKWIETTNVDDTKTLYIGNDLWRKTEKYKSYKEKKIYNQNWIETTNVDGTKTLYTFDLKNKIKNYTGEIEEKTFDNIQFLIVMIGKEHKIYDTGLIESPIYKKIPLYGKSYIEKTIGNIKTLYTFDLKNKIENYKTIKEKTVDNIQFLIVMIGQEHKFYDTGLIENLNYKSKSYHSIYYIEKTIGNIKTLYTFDLKNKIENYKTIKEKTVDNIQFLIVMIGKEHKFYDTGLIENTIYKITNKYNKTDYIEKTNIDGTKTLYTFDLKNKIENYKTIEEKILDINLFLLTVDNKKEFYDDQLNKKDEYKIDGLYIKKGDNNWYLLSDPTKRIESTTPIQTINALTTKWFMATIKGGGHILQA